MREEVKEVKLKWNHPYLSLSMILMFIGATFPTILPKFLEIDLIVSVVIGAIVSIVGNLAFIYATKSKLITTEIIYRL